MNNVDLNYVVQLKKNPCIIGPTQFKPCSRANCKWKDIICSWNGRINIVKMTLLKAIHKSNTIPIRIPPAIFCSNRKALPKIHAQSQGTLNNQNSLEKVEPCWMTHTN